MKQIRNPWIDVALADYESHMRQSNVMQLQTLDRIMLNQFQSYHVKSVAIMGVAGGNGLGNLLDMPDIKHVIGIDINPEYLETSRLRYPGLSGRYSTLMADIRDAGMPTFNLNHSLRHMCMKYGG